MLISNLKSWSGEGGPITFQATCSMDMAVSINSCPCLVGGRYDGSSAALMENCHPQRDSRELQECSKSILLDFQRMEGEFTLEKEFS